ncbi:hypothetical protein LTR66_003422 [Elasticomyces elasticus]|nr:hypothetical protein LTR66_003422 [Elasticomyces elasticus]
MRVDVHRDARPGPTVPQHKAETAQRRPAGFSAGSLRVGGIPAAAQLSQPAHPALSARAQVPAAASSTRLWEFSAASPEKRKPNADAPNIQGPRGQAVKRLRVSASEFCWITNTTSTPKSKTKSKTKSKERPAIGVLFEKTDARDGPVNQTSSCPDLLLI